jgi:hypothetical protein
MPKHFSAFPPMPITTSPPQHRAMIKCWNDGDSVTYTKDIGFPYGITWQQSPKVVLEVYKLEQKYNHVEVETRDV